MNIFNGFYRRRFSAWRRLSCPYPPARMDRPARTMVAARSTWTAEREPPTPASTKLTRVRRHLRPDKRANPFKRELIARRKASRPRNGTAPRRTDLSPTLGARAKATLYSPCPVPSLKCSRRWQVWHKPEYAPGEHLVAESHVPRTPQPRFPHVLWRAVSRRRLHDFQMHDVSCIF